MNVKNPSSKLGSHKLYPLSDRVLEDLKKVELALRRIILDCTPELKEAAEITIKAGGKRLRPALVLTVAEAGKYNLERLTPLALAIELIHTATLVHDDVLDKAQSRRGMPTVNARYGRKRAIATGDLLLGKAFELLSLYKDSKIFHRMAEVALILSEGELRQQNTAYRTDQTIEECYERIRSKTASLFSASCELGARVSEAEEIDISSLKEYGEHLGMAFQIFDDILDFTAETKILGKPVGSDIKEGIATLPLIFALEESDNSAITVEEKGYLKKILKKREPTLEEVEEAIQIVLKSGGIEKSRQIAIDFITQALKAIESLSNPSLRSKLETLGYFVIQRSH